MPIQNDTMQPSRMLYNECGCGSLFELRSRRCRQTARCDAINALPSVRGDEVGTGKYPVGVNIAISDDQSVGTDSQRDVKRPALYSPWPEAAAKSDFAGVQTYTRSPVVITIGSPQNKRGTVTSVPISIGRKKRRKNLRTLVTVPFCPNDRS